MRNLWLRFCTNKLLPFPNMFVFLIPGPHEAAVMRIAALIAVVQVCRKLNIDIYSLIIKVLISCKIRHLREKIGIKTCSQEKNVH